MKNSICKEGNIHFVGVSKKYHKKLFDTISGALYSAGENFKYKKNVDIAIFDAEFWDIPSGMDLVAHARVYYIDCKICFYRKDIDIKKVISVELPLTIHHEFSHVVRANTVGYPETLLDSFIDEGIACYIEQIIKPDRSIPYIQKHENESDFWSKIKNDISQVLTSEIHNEWFFGTGKLPNWIGYRLGFLIVKSFMDKHNLTFDKLVRTPSKKILEGSSFNI